MLQRFSRRFAPCGVSLVGASASARGIAPRTYAKRWASVAPPSTPLPHPDATTPPPSTGSSADPTMLLAEKYAAMLTADPELLRATLNEMNPEARRKLVISAVALDFFGKDTVNAEVKSADVDHDKFIGPKDFDRWMDQALRRKAAKKTAAVEASSAATASTNHEGAAGEVTATPPIDGTPAAATGASSSSVDVPFKVLLMIAIESGLPFVGFGFLDNASMILAGDAIDRSIGIYFHLSVMATAALGNVVAGCMGMQVHGFIEKLIHRLNLPVPELSDAQRKSQRVFMAGHIGGTIGIMTGLCLGMLPLLVISNEDEKHDHKIFAQMDANSDGYISAAELTTALAEAGFPVTLDIGLEQLRHYAKEQPEKGISFAEFHTLVTHHRDLAGGKTLATA